MPKMLNFFYLLVILKLFEINCISAAEDDEKIEECIYLKNVDLATTDLDNPLFEGLNKGNDSWYKQFQWSDLPRDYLILQYSIWEDNGKSVEKIKEKSIYLCANKPGTEDGSMTRLMREAMGIGERCPINLGINDTDPDLFAGKKCRAMNSSIKFNSKLKYSILFGIIGKKLSTMPMSGFIRISAETF